MNNNLTRWVVAVTSTVVTRISFWKTFISILLIVTTGYARAQSSSNIPLTVTIQFDTGTTHRHYTKTLDPTQGQTTFDDSSTGTSPTGGTSSASVHIELKGPDHWQIVQTVESNPIGADVVVGWLPFVTAAGKLSTTISCPNPAFPCGANADFLWAGHCLFVSPFNYGPQGTCQTHYGDLSYMTTFQASAEPPSGASSFVECITGSCKATVTTDLEPQGDMVELRNTSGSENGILVNGLTALDGRQWEHQTFTSVMDTIPLGENVTFSGSDNGNEVVAFTRDRPVALQQAVNWTPNIDKISVAFQNGPIQIPVRVWIVIGDGSPYAEMRDAIVKRLEVANSIWVGSRAGVHFDLDQIVDATLNPFAPLLYNFDCFKAPFLSYPSQLKAIQKEIGYIPGEINVYMAGEIASGVADGETCFQDPSVIGLLFSSQAKALAHELGHALGLGHVGIGLDQLVPDFDPDNNLMWSGFPGPFLSEGQTFRANLASYSVVNLLGRRSGPTRDCETHLQSLTSQFTLSLACPAINKRIWPDGPDFPPN